MSNSDECLLEYVHVIHAFRRCKGGKTGSQTVAHNHVKPMSVLLDSGRIEILIFHSLAHIGQLLMSCNFDIGALSMYYMNGMVELESRVYQT